MKYVFNAKEVQKQHVRILKETTQNDKGDKLTSYMKEINKEKDNKTHMIIVPKKAPRIVGPPQHLLAKRMLNAAKCKSKAKKPMPKPSCKPGCHFFSKH